MTPSFEEKSVWIQLISLLVVLGGYFLVAQKMLASGVTVLLPYAPVFAVAIVLLVVVLIVGHVVAAVASRPEGRDERDRLIEWRAESGSSWLLAVGVLAAIGGLMFSIESVWIAHLLLASLFVSEVASLGLRLVYYRRGV